MTAPAPATAAERQTEPDPRAQRPWPALWALVIGFFMILVDSTIVSIATPALMEAFEADVTHVIWVTSAYLLAYAVPLLITGRLGDRFGPKVVYLVGLATFTIASLWCGFAGTIGVLILARVVQGLGAALMTPQTMAVITRTFPPDRRGAAMGLWGGIAGLATLVGPLLGGFLIDSAGWAWIFFINVPVGILAFVLVVRLVPNLTLHSHAFDWFGVVLSALAMFAITFAVQEGETYAWGAMPIAWGDVSFEVPLIGLLAAGVLLLMGFVWWQAVQQREPLVPLSLLRDRNFSLGSLAILVVGFVITSMSIPMFLYTQTARGLTPTESALLLVPMALLAGILSPAVGKRLQGGDLRWPAAFGIACVGGALAWHAALMQPAVPVVWLLAPSALMGIGNAFMWGPISMATTRNLPPQAAGAGSGVYNAMRQVGAVIGSAAIAAMMTSRLTAELGDAPTRAQEAGTGGLPGQLVAPFSAAMGQSLLLPAVATLVAIVAVLCWERPRRT